MALSKTLLLRVSYSSVISIQAISFAYEHFVVVILLLVPAYLNIFV